MLNVEMLRYLLNAILSKKKKGVDDIIDIPILWTDDDVYWQMHWPDNC